LQKVDALALVAPITNMPAARAMPTNIRFISPTLCLFSTDCG
jgi:hypothetical protein